MSEKIFDQYDSKGWIILWRGGSRYLFGKNDTIVMVNVAFNIVEFGPKSIPFRKKYYPGREIKKKILDQKLKR